MVLTSFPACLGWVSTLPNREGTAENVEHGVEAACGPLSLNLDPISSINTRPSSSEGWYMVG